MAAIIVPLVLVVYLLVADFVDLFPYNDVSKHTSGVRKWELINYIMPVFAALSSWQGNVFSAFSIASLFLMGNIYSWWIPYFFGCSQKQKKRLEDHFGRTIKILPAIKDHPIPNLEHLPVTILIVIWWIAALKGL